MCLIYVLSRSQNRLIIDFPSATETNRKRNSSSNWTSHKLMRPREVSQIMLINYRDSLRLCLHHASFVTSFAFKHQMGKIISSTFYNIPALFRCLLFFQMKRLARAIKSLHIRSNRLSCAWCKEKFLCFAACGDI